MSFQRFGYDINHGTCEIIQCEVIDGLPTTGLVYLIAFDVPFLTILVIIIITTIIIIIIIIIMSTGLVYLIAFDVPFLTILVSYISISVYLRAYAKEFGSNGNELGNQRQVHILDTIRK